MNENEAAARIIEEILRDAFDEYNNQVKVIAQSNALGVPRPRQFVLKGTGRAKLIWPAIIDDYDDEEPEARTEMFTLETSDGDSRLVHVVYLDNKDHISKLILDDPRAAMRVLRQADELRAWVQARKQGIQRAIDELTKQRAHIKERLEAEIALRKMRGLP